MSKQADEVMALLSPFALQAHRVLLAAHVLPALVAKSCKAPHAITRGEIQDAAELAASYADATMLALGLRE